jgi:hypothetical protein
MQEDSPQPDVYLRILPERGGQSGDRGLYAQGAPELVAEICLSSTAYDLHQKLAAISHHPFPAPRRGVRWTA